ILAGLLRSGWSAAELAVFVRRTERAQELAARYSVAALTEPRSLADYSHWVVAVKPKDLTPLARRLREQLHPELLLLSLVGGISLAELGELFPGVAAVIRVMPNTPALVGRGMSLLSSLDSCPEPQLAKARRIFEAVGAVLELPESQQSAGTALSGCGPAYFFYLVETMIDAGVQLGLSRQDATSLAGHTLTGAGALLAETGMSAARLREQVTSPGGITAAALRELDRHGVRSGLTSAIEAAAGRGASAD
ncbi:MAG: pyrroline-5-carboxylate reductase, partial [Angustibacter sp.]